MTSIVGWLSSAILLVTISNQVFRQWRSGTSKGVSSWLFVGQFAASTGFCAYSILQHDTVFTVTNGLMALAAATGFTIVRIHRRREGRQAAQTLQPRRGESTRAAGVLV